MLGIIPFLRYGKLGKEGLIMGAALIMFPRSDIAREFRATAHKALGEWIDELEESFESNPAPNVMDFSEIFQQSHAKILALTMKASIERLFPSFLEHEWVQSFRCDRQLRRKLFESKQASALQGSFVLKRPCFFVSTVGIDSDIIRQEVRQQQEDEVRTEQSHLWKDNDG
jgi:hypothetical protein